MCVCMCMCVVHYIAYIDVYIYQSHEQNLHFFTVISKITCTLQTLFADSLGSDRDRSWIGYETHISTVYRIHYSHLHWLYNNNKIGLHFLFSLFATNTIYIELVKVSSYILAIILLLFLFLFICRIWCVYITRHNYVI